MNLKSKYLKLRAERARLDLTQSDVAKVLEISVKSYSKKELGYTDFTMREINKLIEYFDKTYEELFT